MNPELKKESEKLQWVWDQRSSEALDAYLVVNQEDPRVNLQSILTRSFLIDALWPDEFTDLISDEIRFGAVLSWLLQRLSGGESRESLLDSICQSEGTLPQFIRDTCAWLESADCPVPDYVLHALSNVDADHPERLLDEGALSTFEDLWPLLLKSRPAGALRMVEFGSGSANDYRYLESFGLARFTEYRGLDISRRNIDNARRRCPSAAFEVGNIFESGLPDHAAEYVLVQDVFEHLSPAGLEVAIEEAMRVCRKEAWLHFFNAADTEQHEIQPVDDYYWNRLSIDRLVESLGKYAASVEVIVIQDMLNTRFDYGNFYNPEAVTIIASK
jgi:SAM-dependent methyltransferase